MIECTRKIEFDAGHRVIGHEFKCKYLHGHRYVLEVTAISDELDNLGMVVDFGKLKNVVKKWIDDNFDHTVILHKSDQEMGDYLEKYTGQKLYYLENNPTAENIALHLKETILPELFKNESFRIAKLKLYETSNAFVEINDRY